MSLDRTTSQVLFDNGTHKCISFTSLVKGEGVQANQFLIIDHERAAVLDPGGDLTYIPLTMELNRYTRLANLDYVMASHQDPDIITSMPRWLVYTDAKVVASKLWARFLPHLNSAFMSDRMKGNWLDRLVELPDQGQSIALGHATILAIPAHFLHSVGNFQFYDPVSKILFSGDMGASMVENASQPLEDFEAHIPKMKAFHQRYMCANKVIRLWVNMVRKMDIEMIVPQHGSAFIGKEKVKQFLDWIETLQCGVDLMDERIFHCPV
ncbi:oxygen-binding di-iron domain-containing protein [Acinetobacter radioresistens]|uniref:MBL fold metallo-hydrolase n=1 Tax=Acinetobacter radioresistens TaxID=40216 RepID=UPI000E76C17D|nr:MBL fold metallo-hydrolase [Acinetobacter radioresistens]RJL69041.1 FprA family A-type flavoprotein [Acinetobacter radioresistens]